MASNFGAFALRFDNNVPDDHWRNAVNLLPILLVVRLAVFVPLRLFEGLWRYTSLWDLRNIILGVGLSTALFAPVAMFLTEQPTYPRSVYLIDSLLLVSLLSAVRLSRRLYREFGKPQSGRRLLIYGAGDAGELIVRDIRQNAQFAAVPIGFVDDDLQKIGRRIHGLPVFGGRDLLPSILKQHSPEELLIAIPSASRDTLREIVRVLEPFQVRITTLPRLQDLVGAKVDVGQIRQLKVEDLLAREAIGLDYRPIREFLGGKRVLVTGAGGSIGSELCRQIVQAKPAKLVLLDRYENSLFGIHHELRNAFPYAALLPTIADVTDKLRMEQIFSDEKPQVVFHAAAHKHVPLMEANPCEAIKNNVRGTRIIAEASARYAAERFVLISTDKAVNPTSVMGATKRVAELLVAALSTTQATRSATVRFGNVLGSNGSVVPIFLAQIAKGGPVTVTHPEMKRFFMLIPEAVQLVLHAGALHDSAPLFVLEMGKQVKVVEMARDLIRLSGFVPDKDIEISFTGVRPGEKLFEELIGDDESAEPSSVDKIFRVIPKVYLSHQTILEGVERLEALAISSRSAEAMRELRILVPNFQSDRHRAATS